MKYGAIWLYSVFNFMGGESRKPFKITKNKIFRFLHYHIDQSFLNLNLQPKLQKKRFQTLKR